MSEKTSVDPLRLIRFQLVGMPSGLLAIGRISAPLLGLTQLLDAGKKLCV
jgi:hypothetical protein